MTTPRALRRSIAILAVVSVVAACGGDDDGGGAGNGDGGDGGAAADTPIGQALTAEFMAESEDSPISTEEEARCVSGGIVSEIGEDRLAELGVTPESIADSDIEDVAFTAEEAGTIVDTMFDCVDVKAALATEFEADFGAEGAQCLADNLDEDLIRDLMASSFLGDETDEMPDDFFQSFLDIAAECDLPLD
jgi:hypothetical protein